MQMFRLNRRRSERLLLIIGQLVLIAYVFQVGAFDHWGGSHASEAGGLNVTGIPGTSVHSTVHDDHCHAGPGSCADAGGGYAQFSPDQTIRLPAGNPLLVVNARSVVLEPREAVLSMIPQPPKAAA